ncbi:MAG: Rpn family recombination-promoting nuclease/putative transposase [Lachnospiraceae bacterium]|nr:Rpn family recombination-promoting nuclease/putative transposase [Lachnospiraceae bacterium]
MPKKKQDLKPDTVLKNYWRDNERFADFFNAVLFEGKQIIKPDELEDRDTDESSLLEHRESIKSIQESRDNIKIRKKFTAYGIELVMLGLESQEHIHYAMPMRVMGYDYSVYKKQYDSNAKKCKQLKGLDEDEILSGMRKTDKFAAVITVVVYYGEKPWDGAMTLHEMLDIPGELKKYVNDYQMLLVEARKNNLVFHNADNVDFFNLLGIVLDHSIPRNEAKEKAIQYSEEHETDRSVIMTVAGATNSKINYSDFEKGDGRMCTLFEEIARESEEKGIKKGIEKGKTEGKAEGIIETGFEFGLSENAILERLQNKLHISLQMAQEYLVRFGRQTV